MSGSSLVRPSRLGLVQANHWSAAPITKIKLPPSACPAHAPRAATRRQVGSRHALWAFGPHACSGGRGASVGKALRLASLQQKQKEDKKPLAAGCALLWLFAYEEHKKKSMVAFGKIIYNGINSKLYICKKIGIWTPETARSRDIFHYKTTAKHYNLPTRPKGS